MVGGACPDMWETGVVGFITSNCLSACLPEFLLHLSEKPTFLVYRTHIKMSRDPKQRRIFHISVRLFSWGRELMGVCGFGQTPQKRRTVTDVGGALQFENGLTMTGTVAFPSTNHRLKVSKTGKGNRHITTFNSRQYRLISQSPSWPWSLSLPLAHFIELSDLYG